MSRLTQSATRSGSIAAAATASLPTTTPSSSKSTTLGVSRSPLAFTMLVGRPCGSRNATTE